MLSTAVQWQIIFSNPCDRVKPPKVERKEARYLDDVQTVALFEHLHDEPLKYRNNITLFVYSGMRRGELCGLKWTDIDFNQKTINIQRAKLYLPGKGVYDETTKNYSSERVIKVANTAISLLKEYQIEHNIERQKVGNQWIETGAVFTAWNGKPMHPDTITK